MRIGPGNANSFALKLPGVGQSGAASAAGQGKLFGSRFSVSAGSGGPRTTATGDSIAAQASVKPLLRELRQLVASAPNQVIGFQRAATNAGGLGEAAVSSAGRRASQAVRTTARTVVSGLNALQVTRASVAGLPVGGRVTLSGEVTRSATRANLTVVGGAGATVTAGGDHTLSGVLGSATLELSAGQSLFEVAELVNERTEQTGVTASVVGNDLVLASSEVGSSAVVGLSPIDGPDLSIAGVNGGQVESFEVSGFASGQTEIVSGSLVSAAEGAALAYHGDVGGVVAGTASFRLSGARGAANLSIVEGESLAAVAGRINLNSAATGVVATVSGNDLLLASDSRGAGARVQIDSLEPEYSTSVTGLNGAQVVDFSVVSLDQGSEHTIEGQVLQAATRAALTLQGSGQGTVIDSATFEVSGALGAATISIDEGETLAAVAARVNAESGETGVVAAVEGTQVVLRSAAVGSAANVNVDLIHVNHTIQVSGVNSQQLSTFQVQSFADGASRTLSGSVTQTAGRAELTFTASFGVVGTNATFNLSGSLGSAQISVTSLQSLNTFVNNVNARTGTTGVTAVREGNLVRLRSVGVGSSATVAVAVTSGSFQTSGGNGNGTANGTNAVAIVNGQTITGAGNSFQFSDAVGSYSFTSAAGFTGAFSTVTVQSIAGSFNLAGGDGSGSATGTDALAEINGVQLTGVADRFSVDLAGGDFELEFAEGFAGSFAPITVRSVAAEFEISGGNGAGLDFGEDGVALINGSEVTSASDRFEVAGEHGSYVIEFASGFSGQVDPITISTPELSLMGADEAGAAYGTDAEATINGQHLVGNGSRFTFLDQGRQAAIEFQTGFLGEFNEITVTRRERATIVDEEPKRSRAGVGEDLAAVDAIENPSADLLAEVDRLLAAADGEFGEADQETSDAGSDQGLTEAASQAEVVRQQFAAVVRQGYFGSTRLDADARVASLAQLSGLLDLIA